MTFLPGNAKLHAKWQCRTKGTPTVIGTYDVEVDITLQKGVHSTLKVILPNADASPITVSTTVAPWTGDVIDVEMRAPTNLAMTSAIDGSPLAAESTANCYIVRANGNYQIPLVYGNAIKDGVTNTSAFYNATASTAFEDSYGTKFTASSSPYIKDHASAQFKQIGDAEVLWTHGDAQIRIVKVDSDYLTFSVSSFSPSNALIAVKDWNGTILWSWHLWLTEQDLSPETITNSDGTNFQIMPVPLGWNGWTTEMVDGVAQDRSTAPYYQWGRKDPFIPVGTPTSGGNIEYSTTAKTQAQVHQTPKVYYYYNHGNWCDTFANYYWDADNATASTDSPVVKTIYDPCPVGWNVPQTFTVNNGVIGKFNKGQAFKRNSADKTGIFFPAVGNRSNSNGNIASVGTNGYFWLSVPMSIENNAIHIALMKGPALPDGSTIGLIQQGPNNSSNGYSIWPSLSQD